jgi:divalent metal cation (Fe/Co/Zn/Cd) transporter
MPRSTGWQWIDIIVSLAVAANIVVQGVRLIRRSALGLLDTAIPAEERALIMAILDRYQPEGVTYHALRTRQSGVRTLCQRAHAHTRRLDRAPRTRRA